MKKKKDITDTNIADDLFWAMLPERKDRTTPSESSDEDEQYLKDIEDKKRARYEALRKKASDY